MDQISQQPNCNNPGAPHNDAVKESIDTLRATLQERIETLQKTIDELKLALNPAQLTPNPQYINPEYCHLMVLVQTQLDLQLALGLQCYS